MHTTCIHPQVPPPAGAETVDRWEGDPQSRYIAGVTRRVAAATVFANGFQLADGTVDDGHIIDAPKVCVEAHPDHGALTPGQARELAAAIIETADEIEGWLGERSALINELRHLMEECPPSQLTTREVRDVLAVLRPFRERMYAEFESSHASG